jgi:hypothetical protein
MLHRALLVVALAIRAFAADPCATTVGTVAGTVTAAGGGPIAGARVRVQGCLGEPVTTDAAGAFTLAVPAATSVVAAAAVGHYIGCWKDGTSECAAVAAGASGLAIVLDPLPADDDPAHVFRAPETCKPCHEEIYEQWSRSTMAFTNRNRWVDNLYNGTDVAMPLGPAPNPANPPYFSFLASHNVDPANPTRNGECANCHQPEYVGTDPTNTSFNAYTSPDHRGITCDFCHKIVGVDVSPEGIRRPNLVVGEHGLPAKTTMLRSASEPWLVFGPFEDATFDGGTAMRAAHATVVRSSRLCAACHEDHADSRDQHDDFTERYDGPPSQTTYSEWAASDYAARGIECQDCHMPPTGADRFCNRVPFTRDGSQVRSHVFEGTTPEFLQRAVTLRARATTAEDVLTVAVDVTNSGAGHDLPTGVTIRNLVLVVRPTTRDGTPLEQLAVGDAGGSRVPNWGGVGDPAAGNFAGLPGKGYARVLVDENLVENVLFTEAVAEFDNRIAAGATDRTTYRFRLPKGWQKAQIRVETQLWYRRAFKPLADQRKWTVPLNGNPNGTRGDGTDYDGGLVIARRRNLLRCAGKLAKLVVTGTAGGGTLEVAGVLKLPRKTPVDPVRDGAHVTLGAEGADTLAVDEDLAGITGDGKTFAYSGTSAVRSLRLTAAGKRAFKVALALGDVAAATAGSNRIEIGIESGDVCARRMLRCKTSGSTVRCR